VGRQPAGRDVFSAIADPTRRALLDGLSEGDRPVSALAGPLGMSLSAVSQHLRVLKETGLVSERRDGRDHVYRLEAAPLLEVDLWVRHYERFWRARLLALGDHLERAP
jgi:DNA-binding transcriptional ArsR family regulator